MKTTIVVVLSLLMLGFFDKPAEGGLFFRRGPIRRFLFGPFRRRMLPRMVRRVPCMGCLPRNFRNPGNFCGPGVHGGRCGFNNFNNLNFRNFDDFRFRRDQFNPFFDPGVDPRLNFIPNSFDDFRNRNLGGGFTPVSLTVEDPQSDFEKQFRQGLLPKLESIRSGRWTGQCEIERGIKERFNLSLADESVEQVRERGLYFPQTAQVSYLVRTNAEADKLFLRIDSAQNPRFCVLERN